MNNLALADEIAKHMAVVVPETGHFFAEGLYARKMTCQAGEMVIGKSHKQGHFAILLEGVIQVQSKSGKQVLQAPYITRSEPGDKRAFYSLTKTVWLTVHATEETNIAVLESTLVDEL